MSQYHFESQLVRSLATLPATRSATDLALVYAALRRLDTFEHLGDAPLRALCRVARLERHPVNEVLFRKGEPATCWYILLSGSVFADNQLYLPRACFGKRTGRSNRRPHDCLVLEQSDMIVIDYPDVTPTSSSGSSSQPQHGHTRQPQHRLHCDPRISDVHGGRHTSGPAGARAPDYTAYPAYSQHGSHLLMPTSSQHHTAVSMNLAPTSNQVDSFDEDATLTRNGHQRVVTRCYFGESPPLGHKSAQPYGGSAACCASARSSTSSAYSGSVHQPSQQRAGGAAGSLPPEDESLSGLPEAAVDSDDADSDLDLCDDESCPSGDSLLCAAGVAGSGSESPLCDNVRLALDKEPDERTESDLNKLLEFMLHMPAFAEMPVGVKRELCRRMVFAQVERQGDIIMRDGEILDSWCVIVNGEVEVIMPSGQRQEFHLGDAFGVQPAPGEQRQLGTMRAAVADCQFVLVAQEDFVRIMAGANEHRTRGKDGTEYEKRVYEGQSECRVLVRASTETLLDHLLADRDSNADPYYVEDFLLMYRVFMSDPVLIFRRFLHWFEDPHKREKVARLVLLWVNNHFNDFETNAELMQLLDQFELRLESHDMHNHQSLLNIACSVKSRARTVTYTRSNRDDMLHFSVLGGKDSGYGIFVSKVESNSQAERVGLKRGDEILEVNNQSFTQIPHQRALEVLRGSTHLAITVKSNLLGFKEMLAAGDRADSGYGAGQHSPKRTALPGGRIQLKGTQGSKQGGKYAAGFVSANSGGSGASSRQIESANPDAVSNCSHGTQNSNLTKIRSYINRIRMSSFGQLHDNESLDSHNSSATLGTSSRGYDAPDSAASSRSQLMKHSRSNPDIANHQVQSGVNEGLSQYYRPTRPANPEHVLKIYRADQSFKYLTVYRETTAGGVVALSLQEFGMQEESSPNWSLCEVTATSDGVVKQRRLPDTMSNLAERIQLNSRYYLKNNLLSDPLVPDSLAHDLAREAATKIATLSAHVVAAQLTLQDYAIFAGIEPTEWVATEICREKSSALKRARLVKKFIKIARHCRDFHNFNSMFAVVSGLEKPAVRRLHNTWERVPAKWMRVLKDLQALLDPSRNMSRYRQHLAECAHDPPVVPLFPMIKKDLTFINDGNKTTVTEGIINFDKLRMIAKEIRAVMKMASAPYELQSMGTASQAGGGGRLDDALLYMNSFEGGANVATIRRPLQMSNQTQTHHSLPRPAAIPRKKLYEQALMVRKVKSYLSSLDVIDTESLLDQLSVDCEAPGPSGSSNSVGKQQHHQQQFGLSEREGSVASTSPGGRLSAAAMRSAGSRRSAASIGAETTGAGKMAAHGPKFGMDSPAAVQKLLALASETCCAPTHQGTLRSGRQAAVCGTPPGRLQRDHHRHRHGQPPVMLRRQSSNEDVHCGGAKRAGGGGKCAKRRQSATPLGACSASDSPVPVVLTAESSAVSGTGSRVRSTGSLTSTDSTVSSCPSAALQQPRGATLSAASAAVPGHGAPPQSMSQSASCDSADSGKGGSSCANDWPPPPPPLVTVQHAHRLGDKRADDNKISHISLAQSHRPQPMAYSVLRSAAAAPQMDGAATHGKSVQHTGAPSYNVNISIGQVAPPPTVVQRKTKSGDTSAPKAAVAHDEQFSRV